MVCSCTPARLEHWWISNWESWRQGARGGWRQEAPGGWRLEARGSWRLHRARSDFSSLDTGRKSPAPRLESAGSDSMDKNPVSGCCFLPSRSSCPGETGMQRRQQHPAATQGGSSLGEVWLWVSHRLASCRVMAGQGGNAHRVAACRGCHPACCSPSPCSWAELRFEAASPREIEPKLPACAWFCAISRWWHRSKHCG